MSSLLFPRVTVITPTLNSGKYLDACILSVAGQAYDNKEHLIIDSRSLDGTLEIIDSYSKIYKHIRSVCEKDQGIYDAMNKGIRMAQDGYILFLGSDDELYDVNVLSDIFTKLDMLNYDIIYGNVMFEKRKTVGNSEFTKERFFTNNIPHQAIFCRRETYLKDLGWFDLKYKLWADYEMNLRWFENPNIKSVHIDKVISIYGEDGLSKGQSDHHFIRDARIIYSQNFKLAKNDRILNEGIYKIGLSEIEKRDLILGIKHVIVSFYYLKKIYLLKNLIVYTIRRILKVTSRKI